MWGHEPRVVGGARMSAPATRPCTLDAWERHEGELRGWLIRRVRGDVALADDLLQTVFLKALRQGRRFCAVERARAWLFATARNAAIDHLRLQKHQVPLPEELSEQVDERPPVDSLTACLPRALEEMGEQDAEILRQCDLEGMTQAEYARLHGLSVPGAKSRLQRARRRLEDHLTRVCQVRRDEDGRVCCFVPRAPASDPPA